MYIGGASRGCSQPNLTADWVAESETSAEIAEVRWTPLHDPPDDLAPMLEHHVLPVIRATADKA